MVMAGVLIGFLGLVGTAQPVMARECNPPDFLGMRAWYTDLSMDPDTCAVLGPKDASLEDGGQSLTVFVWIIVLNILSSLMSLGGMIAFVMVIVGGFRYILSKGDPNGVIAAKRTLGTALTGITIIILAEVIVHTIIEVIK